MKPVDATPLTRVLLDELSPPTPPLRFDAYMARALFDPTHGYYASGTARLGRSGDFYTSVTATRMFGRILAEHFATVWNDLGRPAGFTLVEQGANDGTFAADVLDALRERHPDLHATLHLHLIEPFADLRETQIRTLARHPTVPFTHHQSLDDLPPFTGVHFTNEYADALPVRVFERGTDAWTEWHVTTHADALTIALLPPTEADTTQLPADAPPGYLAEFRPASSDWITSVAHKLQRGQILTVDYGFLRSELHAPWRTNGTLSCYRDHQRDDDPLADPGEKDLTAHVDFTTLIEAAEAAGLTVTSFTDQYHFLVQAARPLLLELETQPDTPQRTSDLCGFKTLLHPEIMGTQFKFLTLTR